MSEKLKFELRKQDDLFDRLKKALTNYKKSPKERITATYIETKLEALEKLCETFFEGHNEIAAAIERSDKSKLVYFEDDVYSQFEDVYSEYKTKLKDDLSAFKPTRESSSGSSYATGYSETSGCEVKLPQIHLPKFSGGYEEWQTFHDMFDSLINKNISLSAVQKLHYLKSCFSGEAENLLRNLSTIESNYSEAWRQLTRRYSNKRYNSNEIMKRLFAQKSITNQSATAIKQLLDTTSSCLKSLENLNVNISSWDVIINYLIVSKLDLESRKLWELEVNRLEPEDSVDYLPTWSELKKYLETRFRTLEMLEPS
ncbi:hypothetical protein K1T71_015271 [Dendrolimus kikuchii]|nr:hypothetical protein K1T71_015271 [Dendrolimus kikuchii]